MNPKQIAKLRARAGHLLDLFIALREKYAMLQPLAFDDLLAERVGPQGRGHTILKNTLLQSCVQDLVKLTVDTDRRTPSVHNLMTTLEDGAVRQSLLHDYAVVPPPVFTNDAPPREILLEIQAEEERRLAEQFKNVWSALSARWLSLKDGERLPGFKIWRNKLIAHSELHHSDGRYRLTDLSEQGLKWDDLGTVIDELQAMVEGITNLTRSAGFAWGLLDKQLDEVSSGFWSLIGQAPADDAAV